MILHTTNIRVTSTHGTLGDLGPGAPVPVRPGHPPLGDGQGRRGMPGGQDRAALPLHRRRVWIRIRLSGPQEAVHTSAAGGGVGSEERHRGSECMGVVIGSM